MYVIWVNFIKLIQLTLMHNILIINIKMKFYNSYDDYDYKLCLQWILSYLNIIINSDDYNNDQII